MGRKVNPIGFRLKYIRDWNARWYAEGTRYRVLLQEDFAIRRLDVHTWKSPLAKRWLGGVSDLPYLLVYSSEGERVAEVRGANLAAIDQALADGAR